MRLLTAIVTILASAWIATGVAVATATAITGDPRCLWGLAAPAVVTLLPLMGNIEVTQGG